MENFFDRYAHYIMPVTECGCWIWTGPAMAAGYGWVKRRYAHRWAYETVHGEGSAAGSMVRHTCDIPACVNPDHLLLGDVRDNARDMRERGRSLTGGRNNQAKLQRGDVAIIRTLGVAGLPQSQIGRGLNISQSNVSLVMRGERWGAMNMIEERKAIRKLIEVNADKVDGCIRALPDQMFQLARHPESSLLRRIVADNARRLAEVLR